MSLNDVNVYCLTVWQPYFVKLHQTELLLLEQMDLNFFLHHTLNVLVLQHLFWCLGPGCTEWMLRSFNRNSWEPNYQGRIFSICLRVPRLFTELHLDYEIKNSISTLLPADSQFRDSTNPGWETWFLIYCLHIVSFLRMMQLRGVRLSTKLQSYSINILHCMYIVLCSVSLSVKTFILSSVRNLLYLIYFLYVNIAEQ